MNPNRKSFRLRSLLDSELFGFSLPANEAAREPHFRFRLPEGLFREEADPAVVRAFRSYLGIVGSPASGFEEFAVAVNEYMQRPPFNIVNAADTIGGRKKVRPPSTKLLSLLFECAAGSFCTMYPV